MDSLIEKEILDDSSAYADELKNEEEQSDENDKENQRVSATRYKAVGLHHQWKAKAYKDMPRGKITQQGR
jgi:hypothetical protein